MALWLKENADPSKTLYANNYHPILAYYSGFRLVPAYWNGGGIYDTLSKPLTADSYYVCDAGPRGPTDPTAAFLEANPDFRRIHTISNITLYAYKPK